MGFVLILNPWATEMRKYPRLDLVLLALPLAALVAGCGADDGANGEGADRPTIVVTTTILGDVVSSMIGGHAEVSTVMPAGASPHDFQVSARQGQEMREADLLIVNGAGFEEGLLDVIEAAETDGVPVYEAISAVDALAVGEGAGHGHGHEDEDEDETPGGPEEDHGAEDESGSGDVDPHFFTDPGRMATAAEGILDRVVEQIPALDTPQVRQQAEDHIAELVDLDAEIEAVLAVVPAERRVLVTNHAVFGYFADRYEFEQVGVILPGGGTGGGASAGVLAELADAIEREGVRAIFADTSSPTDLARTLADEVGDVAVVELYSESLGGAGSDADTYPAMMRTNAQRIADALG